MHFARRRGPKGTCTSTVVPQVQSCLGGHGGSEMSALVDSNESLSGLLIAEPLKSSLFKA